MWARGSRSQFQIFRPFFRLQTYRDKKIRCYKNNIFYKTICIVWNSLGNGIRHILSAEFESNIFWRTFFRRISRFFCRKFFRVFLAPKFSFFFSRCFPLFPPPSTPHFYFSIFSLFFNLFSLFLSLYFNLFSLFLFLYFTFFFTFLFVENKSKLWIQKIFFDYYTTNFFTHQHFDVFLATFSSRFLFSFFSSFIFFKVSREKKDIIFVM